MEDVKSDSLWVLISSHCRGPAEANFIRDEIGHEIVQRNEIASQELRLLQSILEEQQAAVVSRRGRSRSLAAPLAVARQFALRDRVSSLLSTIGAEIVFPDPKDRAIAEYIASGGQRPPSAARPQSSARSLSSRSSLSVDSRPSSQLSTQREALDADPKSTVNSLAASGKLQHHRIHEIRADLRSLFDMEHEGILSDITQTQALIEDELRWARVEEPTNADVSRIQRQVDRFEEDQHHTASVSALPTPDGKRKLNPLIIPTPPRGSATGL